VRSEATTSSSQITRRLTLGLLFGFLVMLVLVLVADLRQVRQQVLNFNWVLYPAVLGLTFVNYVLRFVKWHFYLGQVGVNTISWGDSARLFVAGFPLAVTPGKVGEALKAVWLQRLSGLPVGRGIAVVLAERISDGLGVLALSTLGVIAYPRYWPAFAIVLTGLAAVIIISQIRPLALTLLTWGERLPVVNRFVHLLHELYEGSYRLFRPWTTLVAVSLGTISWLAEGIGFYLVLTGLGVPPGWNTLSIAVFIMAFSTVIGAVSALPGGLGASEASIAGMLALLLNVPPGLAAAATLLIRFATLWFGVSLGLIMWLFARDIIGLSNSQAAVEVSRDQS
jgi:uncharacterized protein (TIRG00374 family)